MNEKEQAKPRLLNVVLLGLVSFFNDISSEMILPILPMLIMQLGGGGVAIGLAGGLRDSLGHILNVIFGIFSDKTGKRKIFVSMGYLTSNTAKLCMAFASLWQHLLVLIGLDRVGKAMRRSPGDTLISRSLPQRLGKGFGIHRTLDTMGAILGSLISLWLVWGYQMRFSYIIIIAACIGLIAFIPLVFVQEIKNSDQMRDKHFFTWSTLSQPFKLYLLIESFFALAHVNYMFFILKAQLLYQAGLGHIHPMMLYLISNIAYALVSTPLGILSDRIGRWKMTLAGYLTFAVTCFGFAIAQKPMMLMMLFVLYGFSLGIIKVMQKAFVSDVSGIEIRASALGLFSTVTGLAMLLGGFLAGLAWEFISPTFVFSYAAAITLGCAVAFVMLRKRLTAL